MIIFRTLDVVLVLIMIGMVGVTYAIKYDVQSQISEVHRLERELETKKNMVNLLHAEWAVMIDPSRMKRLAKRYQKELSLEMIQPHQVVELKDIPVRLNDPIEELIRENIAEDRKTVFAENHASHIKSTIQKGLR